MTDIPGLSLKKYEFPGLYYRGVLSGHVKSKCNQTIYRNSDFKNMSGQTLYEFNGSHDYTNFNYGGYKRPAAYLIKNQDSRYPEFYQYAINGLPINFFNVMNGDAVTISESYTQRTDRYQNTNLSTALGFRALNAPYNIDSFSKGYGTAINYSVLVDIPVPLFETVEEAQAFATADEPDYTNCLNYGSEPTPGEGDEFLFIKERIARNRSIIDTIERGVRFKSSGRVALLWDTSSMELYNMELRGIDDISNIQEWDPSNPAGWVRRTALPYSDFCSQGKHNILLGFAQTVYFSTNIPIFRDRMSLENYLQNGEGLDLADNAGGMGYDNEDETNGIGDRLEATPLGDGYAVSGFSHLYGMNTAGISELSRNIFNTDTSIVDGILDGLKLYGANPLDCIIDLMLYPFDIGIFTHALQNSISFGTYVMAFENDIYTIPSGRVVIDCGGLIYPYQRNDWTDFEPYSELYIYLPYIGTYKLDIASFYGKQVSLQYIIDATTGSATACIFANGLLITSYDGTIGIKMPITAIDQSEYSQRMLGNMLNTVKGTVGGVTNTINMMDGGVNPLGLVDAVEGAVGASLNLTGQINSQNIQMKGSASPSTGLCMPQYPILYLIQNEVSYPANERAIVGKPSGLGGKVSNFSGFLKCKAVKLESIATETEKEKIQKILMAGIYV